MRALLPALCFALSSGAHADVYKCVENGRTTFSDAPCATDAQKLDIRPSSGMAAPPPETQAPAAGPSALSVRANNAVKRRQLKDEIDRKDVEEKRLTKEMNSRLAVLKGKKRFANNNLAGATWESSISQEMNAIATSYGSQIEATRNEIARLRRERDAIPE